MQKCPVELRHSCPNTPIYAIRVSTDKQTLENQKHKILEFAFNKKIQIEDFIEVEVSSKKTQKERLIDDLFLKLEENDSRIRTSLHSDILS